MGGQSYDTFLQTKAKRALFWIRDLWILLSANTLLKLLQFFFLLCFLFFTWV